VRASRRERRLPRDVLAAGVASAVFSVSLGAASVALPLLALHAGYSAAGIGALTAVSAVTQMTSRMFLGMVMRRWPDWILITAAAVTLAAANAVVAVSASVVPFVLAQMLQGLARACFWTGSQTHVVRGAGRAISALATVNFVSSLGLLAGPVLAGVLSERSPSLALAAASGVALVAVVPTFLLDRLPPFVPPADRPPGRLWRRPGVDLGCWAGVTAGAWRGLLTSYVPVALAAARQSSATIGALVSVANGASVAGAALVGRVRERGATRGFVLGIVAAGGGTALATVVAGQVVLAAAVLALSGIGAGALQTLGPAMATEAVHPEERGDAIAAAGTFRAAALFVAPLAVAGLLGVVGLAGAMAAAGGAITLPAALSRRRLPLRKAVT
jgi:MFS family permease